MAVLEQNDRLSPELVLVDPDLAAIARSELADPDDTVARLEERSREATIAAAARRLAELDGSEEPRRTVLRAPSADGRRGGSARRRVLVGTAFAATALGAAVLVGMRTTDDGAQPTAAVETPAATTPAPVETTAPESTTPPATTPSAPPRTPTTPSASQSKPAAGARPKPSPSGSRRPPTARRPAARPFAWAPTAGASGYHVELFRGSVRIFAAKTTRPAVEVPGRWRFAGRTRTLAPGTYRWYVWPIVSGRRALEATVQARLTIPRA